MEQPNSSTPSVSTSGSGHDNNNVEGNFSSSGSGINSSSSARQQEQQPQEQDRQHHPLSFNSSTPLSSTSSSSSPSSSSPSSHNQPQQQQQQQQQQHHNILQPSISLPTSLHQFELSVASSSSSTSSNLNQQQNNVLSDDLLTPPEPEPEIGGSIGQEAAIIGRGNSSGGGGGVISDIDIDEDEEHLQAAPANNSGGSSVSIGGELSGIIGGDRRDNFESNQNRRHQLLNCSQEDSSSSISGDRGSHLHNNSATDMFLNDNGCHGHISHQQQHHNHHNHHHHHHHHRTTANISNHHNHSSHNQTVDRLKLLYPNVNENETPLPRSWSAHDKCHSIGLSQNNLRVNYKGAGKQHNDAASVRTANPIPPACGLYYFEVKIISKGKNGYMGIGLTSHNFKMNRLPGWDKQSYGYHGDDGNSFSSSGNGQSYGPTFTTDDIIGCGVNFVNNTCFYTKNGVHLGIAFRDLPSKLYPTVGLQTPGEEVDANFGQEPFKFDQVEDMIKQMQVETKAAIYDFPMPADQGDPTTLLHKMVSSYLVHNGYSLSAEAFSRNTGTSFNEDMSSIRNRQKILKLIMSGKMSHAIEHTLRSYPGLLENNKNLLFMLKCRQFIEMVNGTDTEYCPTNNKYNISPTLITTANTIQAPNQTSVIQSTKSYQNGTAQNTAVINADCVQDNHNQDIKNTFSIGSNNSNESNKRNDVVIAGNDYINDVEMENGHTANGNSCKNGNSQNDSFNSIDADEDMDVDLLPSRKYCHGFERILEFGKELSQMGQQLERENKMNDDDRQMLADAFSLIAYSNPWSSPMGWQLCPSKRESVCSALNSAILESMNYQWRPPLEVCVAHASELLKVMANASLGACAFVNIEDVFPQN